MNREILLKYLKNSCSDKEFEELTNWVKYNVQDKESKNWGFEQWQLLDTELNEKDKEKYRALLHKIHHEINLRSRKREKSKVITFSIVSKWLSRVAAIFFIPLLFAVFYLTFNTNHESGIYADLTVDSVEVIAPIGSRTVVQLSDGTEVNLNYGSRIKYPRTFIGGTREIKLTGEGYFDVAHNPDKPFIVKTGKLKIKALGTEFNVQAYPEEPVISTTLINGKVALEENSTENGSTLIGTILPGQHVEYHTGTGKINSAMGSVDKYIAWKNGKLIFDNTPISVVAKELSRKFNVDIIVEDDIKDLTYTVTFVDDPLYLILDLMTETTPVNYKRHPRKKLPDGSFSKQKIEIVKRDNNLT
jgi:transmembrane sensor